jgi:hypothetical protein
MNRAWWIAEGAIACNGEARAADDQAIRVPFRFAVLNFGGPGLDVQEPSRFFSPSRVGA